MVMLNTHDMYRESCIPLSLYLYTQNYTHTDRHTHLYVYMLLASTRANLLSRVEVRRWVVYV